MRAARSPLVALSILLAAFPVLVGATSPSPPSSPTTNVTTATDPTPTPTPTPSPTPTPTPTPSPTPTPASTPTPTPASTPAPAPTPDPATQRMLEQVRQKLGSGIADTLAAAQRLGDALNVNATQQAEVQQRIDASQARIEALNDEIQRLDAQIAATQQRIDDERAQIAVLARALYQQPDSLLMRLLQAGSVRDMVTHTSDLTEAALRAEALRRRLSDDLVRLNQDEAQRQKDRDQQQLIAAQLSAALTQFEDLAIQMQQAGDDLQSAILDGRAALANVGQQGADLAQQAAAMLEEREQRLIALAEQRVWQQEQLWATLNKSVIPPPQTSTVASRGGARFAWPIQGAVLTQGFGPTAFWLEPALFGFDHFHTGIDLASADTRITAAADGVVAVVGSGTTGYGNYVIVVHSDGFVTLYGHLSATMVTVGQRVAAGQQLGVEGSTGTSTGVHLHFEVRLHGAPLDPTPYLPRGSAT